MFTPDQLRSRLFDLLRPRNVVAVEATCLGPEDFTSRSSEESILIHRTSSMITSDPMQFWVSSVVSLDWWEGRGGSGYRNRFLQNSLCRPLSEEQFDELVAGYAGGLSRPIPLPLHLGGGDFVGALQMDDDWNEVSAIAAYTDELIAFYWSTTA